MFVVHQPQPQKFFLNLRQVSNQSINSQMKLSISPIDFQQTISESSFMIKKQKMRSDLKTKQGTYLQVFWPQKNINFFEKFCLFKQGDSENGLKQTQTDLCLARARSLKKHIKIPVTQIKSIHLQVFTKKRIITQRSNETNDFCFKLIILFSNKRTMSLVSADSHQIWFWICYIQHQLYLAPHQTQYAKLDKFITHSQFLLAKLKIILLEMKGAYCVKQKGCFKQKFKDIYMMKRCYEEEVNTNEHVQTLETLVQGDESVIFDQNLKPVLLIDSQRNTARDDYRNSQLEDKMVQNHAISIIEKFRNNNEMISTTEALIRDSLETLSAGNFFSRQTMNINKTETPIRKFQDYFSEAQTPMSLSVLQPYATTCTKITYVSNNGGGNGCQSFMSANTGATLQQIIKRNKSAFQYVQHKKKERPSPLKDVLQPILNKSPSEQCTRKHAHELDTISEQPKYKFSGVLSSKNLHNASSQRNQDVKSKVFNFLFQSPTSSSNQTQQIFQHDLLNFKNMTATQLDFTQYAQDRASIVSNFLKQKTQQLIVPKIGHLNDSDRTQNNQKSQLSVRKQNEMGLSELEDDDVSSQSQEFMTNLENFMSPDCEIFGDEEEVDNESSINKNINQQISKENYMSHKNNQTRQTEQQQITTSGAAQYMITPTFQEKKIEKCASQNLQKTQNESIESKIIIRNDTARTLLPQRNNISDSSQIVFSCLQNLSENPAKKQQSRNQASFSNKDNQSYADYLIGQVNKKTQKCKYMKNQIQSYKENLDLNLRKHEMYKNISKRNEDLYLAEIEELKELLQMQKLISQSTLQEKVEIEKRYNELLDKYNKLMKRLRQLSPQSQREGNAIYLRNGGISMKDLIKQLKLTFMEYKKSNAPQSNSNPTLSFLL